MFTIYIAGNSLLFSRKQINFKVYYDYVPESLRYKVVIRNLDSAKQIAASVDSIILKYISQNTDELANKLLKAK
jgi:hypothetical protein